MDASAFTLTLPHRAGAAPAAGEDAFLERLHAAIEDGLADEDFGVHALASRIAISRSQLYERLRSLTGQTPVQLLQERRLERAARLLAEGAGTVGEIAYAVGFKSVAHFSRQFRARFGVAPSLFRATGRTDNDSGRGDNAVATATG